MKTETKVWASCEECGLAWIKSYVLPKVWRKISCPECGHKTENFDDVNHNKWIKFKHY